MRKIYTSELELPEEYLDAFLQWYAFRHAPDIYQIGFDVCTSYRAIEGDMMILDLYEISSTDIFDTAEYRGVAQMDPYSAAILERRTRKAHSVYTQVQVFPTPVDDRPLLNADWINIERFDCELPDTGALESYFADGEAERILLAGAKRVRLASRTKGGPKHVSNRPRWMLLSEWPHRPTRHDAIQRLQARFGDGVVNQSFFTGYRLFPWMDRPEVA